MAGPARTSSISLYLPYISPISPLYLPYISLINGRTGAQLATENGAAQVLASLAGPLSELRAARLAAKTARRKGERAKRRLLAYALRRCLVGGGICGDGGGGCGGGDGGISSGDGLFLEFGVASGGSINFLAERVPDGTRFGYRVIGIGFGFRVRV